MTLKQHIDDGKTNVIEEQGSSRLTSMTQRVLERKTISSTTETRMEKKSEQRTFRLDV